MEKSRSLNFKIKVKGLSEFKEKIDLLSYEFDLLAKRINKVEQLMKEINDMELVVDLDKEKYRS